MLEENRMLHQGVLDSVKGVRGGVNAVRERGVVAVKKRGSEG